MTPRLSDLLGKPVVDADGNAVGVVHDAAAVQDGPVELPFGALLRIDALEVGGNGFAHRLGFGSERLKGPWLLKATLGRLAGRTQEIPWDMVESWEGDVVRLKPEWSRSPTRR